MFKKILAFVLCLICALPLTACGKSGLADIETNLIIEMMEAGYGTEGMKALADRFEEIYAEEGYQVSVMGNPQLVLNGAYQQLQLGTNSKTDLYFVGAVEVPYIIGKGDTFVKNTNDAYALEDLTEMYGQKVYGENVTYAQKMFPSLVNFNTQTNGKIYSTNWAYNVTGFMYRRENFTEGGGQWTLPRTTKELEELIVKIKGAGKKPFIFCGTTASYFDYAALTWWRQFATDEEVENFWNCQVENNLGQLVESPDAFKTYARLQAYQLVDMCIYNTDNAMHPESMTYNNEQAQMEIYNDENKVIFMPSGDFAENEMNKLDVHSDVGFMRFPVSSEVLKYAEGTYPNIVLKDRFETIKTEEKLREVISVIDAGGACPADVTAADFAALTKIRSYSATESTSHIGYIPSCANAKEVAKKFLLFMASDEANQIYYNVTGSFLPFQAKNLNLGTSITPFRQSVVDMMKNINFVSKYDSKNPLFYMTDLDFNVNEFFMDGTIGTTGGNKKSGLEWFELVADDVLENFSFYQSTVKAG